MLNSADDRTEDSFVAANADPFVARNARDSTRFARFDTIRRVTRLNEVDEVRSRAASVRLPAALAIVIGMTAAEILRQGAFFAKDAFGVAVVSGGLIVFELAAGVDRRARRVALAIGVCALWWWVAAVAHGQGKAFLPLGASMLGFLAGFLVVRRLDEDQRMWAATAIATIGAAAAAIGLEASVTRHFPLAMPAQNLWRLSTTLTYADAAGLLVGIALLVGVSLDQHRWLARVDVYLCAAALVATQSRGAALAVVAGAFLVPLTTARAALRALLVGIASGLVVVATSSGPDKHPVAGVAVLAGLVVAVVVRPPATFRRVTISRRALVRTTLAFAVCAIVAFIALRTPIQRRVELSSTNDRVVEWTAAFKQWWSSPITGTGPDKILRFHAKQGTYAHFAHNEYLQVAAGSGAVGFVLLLLAIAAVAAALRRDDALRSCACGALVAFVFAGLLDFDWHLSALGIVAGCVAGLAAAREGVTPPRAPPADAVAPPRVVRAPAPPADAVAPPRVVPAPAPHTAVEVAVAEPTVETWTSRWRLYVAMPPADRER